MPVFIDTHAHLYLDEFSADRDSVVTTAQNRGIAKIFLPNIDSSSIAPMNSLAEKFPGVCFPTMGLHPTSVKGNFRDEMDRVVSELKTRRYYAIGETGIDLYWDNTFYKEQCRAFREQLDLSLEYNLPVIIHARESFREILCILDDYKSKTLKGVFHAFTGSVETAWKVIELGFMLGIGGILTYKKSDLPEVVRQTGLAHLVLETDSPYLPPVPFRGKRNESSYIVHIAETLATINSIPLREVADITTQNALKLFQPEPDV